MVQIIQMWCNQDCEVSCVSTLSNFDFSAFLHHGFPPSKSGSLLVQIPLKLDIWLSSYSPLFNRRKTEK